jgi:carbamate kinase
MAMQIRTGVESLCDALNVTAKELRALARHGCPIVVIGHGNGSRYFGNLTAIEQWFAAPRSARGARKGRS